MHIRADNSHTNVAVTIYLRKKVVGKYTPGNLGVNSMIIYT